MRLEFGEGEVRSIGQRMFRFDDGSAFVTITSHNPPTICANWPTLDRCRAMCGIAGFLGYPNGAVMAAAANRIQHHRGPDARGIWHDAHMALGHTRLSIIDLDARSDQPFEKGGLVIVFNGEIYNFRALRRELERTHGVLFRTESDTEVVLEAFRCLGAASLDRLEGMFAFAIYDKASRNLFLARDRFGIKPLFYSATRGRFAFASELKVLTALLPGARVPDPGVLINALSYQWVPGTATCIAGLNKMPAAHWFTVDTCGRLTKRCYWQLDESNSAPPTDADVVDLLDHTLNASIDRHMVADVEVGAFLSGGLDSSLIAVLAARRSGRLRTFTIATTAEDKAIERMPADEVYARRLAEMHGFEHQEFVIRADIANELPKAVGWLDEPIGDPAAINTHLICAAARESGVKVLLSGMGADEIFFGYRRQKATLLAAHYRRAPRWLRHSIRTTVERLPVRVAGRGLRTARWARKFVTFAGLPIDAAYRASYSYYQAAELAALLPGQETAIANLEQEHRAIFEEKYRGDPINQMCNTDIRLFMEGLNLTYTDRASMAASTEVRVPFIDRSVVELAMAMPGRLKFRYGRSKYVLKRVARRYLPHDIVHRPKASFGAPIRSWISGALAPMVDDILSRESLERRGLFDPDVVASIVADDRLGRTDNAYRIYQLLTIELWFRQNIDAAPRAGSVVDCEGQRCSA
jgi:asparagine synthase (glutamine-hydrolysing)